MTYHSSIDAEKASRLRCEIVRAGELLYGRRYIVSNDGNISARLTDELLLVTPGGLCKGMLHPDDLIVVDLDGQRVGIETERSRELKSTSELLLHLEAYRQRPDIQAVVHAHPPTAVALSIADISLEECMLPEVIVSLGLIPTTEYATPSSPEGAEVIRAPIAGHDALILRRHGAVTVGRSVMEAYHRMDVLEHFAEIKMRLIQLGRGEPLGRAEVEKLLAQRRTLGLTRPGEDETFGRLLG